MKKAAVIFSLLFLGTIIYAQAQYKSPAQKNHKMSDNRINTKGVQLESKTDHQQVASKQIVFIRMPEKSEPTNAAVISNNVNREIVASDKTAKNKRRLMNRNDQVEDSQVVTNKQKNKNRQNDK